LILVLIVNCYVASQLMSLFKNYYCF